MRALATWCVRHRRAVVLIWLAVLVLVTLGARSLGSQYTDNFTLPHTPSTEAMHLLESVSPQASGDVERVVVGARNLDDPAVRQRVDAMVAALRTVPHVASVTSPYDGAGALDRTHDVGFATVTFDQQTQDVSGATADAMIKAADTVRAPGISMGVSGQVAENAAQPSLGGIWVGILAAGVVLLLVFGSAYAMLLPLVSALASLGTAMGVIAMVSNLLKMPSFSGELVLLIGLGVGIDYALFIVSRHRQGLLAGHDPEASIVTAVNTSGRAVLFAGIIVCIALLGMLVIGVTFLVGLAVAAAIGVLLTMLASLTLVPALLGFIGPRVLSRRQKRRLVASGGTAAPHRGSWWRWACFIERRPLLPALVALGLVLLMALPYLSLRLGSADQGNDPLGSTTRTAYDMLAQGFGPGFNGPLTVVGVVRNPAQRAAVERVDAALARQPGVKAVGPVSFDRAPDGTTVAVITAEPSTAPQDAATASLIDQLRSHTIPDAVGSSGAVMLVGGTTAVLVDFAAVLAGKMPLFIGMVIFLSFVLLAVVFRSLLVPLTAAVMNLLSAAAAFGIVTAVFQWGWAGGLFGVNRAGPIETFLPVMLFAILFGLSMDYEVFLVTRIHEEWLKTGDNRAAVRTGLATTGKTITAAALIMILVFGSFLLGGERVIKEFGLGLAAGVLVDAIVIRATIVPAVMLLLGRANWWFPAWLDRRLPRISVDRVEGEPEDDDVDAEDLVAA